MTPDQLRVKMETLSNFIRDAEGTVLGGQMVDMSGLDKDVAVICNKVVSLPPAQAMELQPLMADMIGSLERLSIALKDYKDNLRS